MIKKSKITIKYFLNKKLNLRTINGEHYYPIYVQITTERKNTQMKSNIVENRDLFKDSDIDTLILDNNLTSKVEAEKKQIITILEIVLEKQKMFDVHLFGKIWQFVRLQNEFKKLNILNEINTKKELATLL